jgi:hypothetical protein
VSAVMDAQPRIGAAYEGGVFIGEGTYRIVAGPHHNGTLGWEAAVSWARALDVDGTGGWSIPTVREMLQLELALPDLIRTGYPYWTCEQAGPADALAVLFETCSVQRWCKSLPAHAIAIRCVFIGGAA